MDKPKLYYGSFISSPSVLKKKISQKIPAALYKKIQRSVPIVCVDLIVISGKKFLLVKRRYEPEAGRWFFPGGRMLKNELAIESARRKLKEETGLVGRDFKLIGLFEYLSTNGRFKNSSTHTPCLVFIARVAKNARVRIDSENTEFQWFSRIKNEFHPYSKQFLRIAGFK